MQNDYINDYNKEHYKQITIRVSPQEADEIKATATQARQSIKQLIISAVRLYAQSLTAAETPTPETPSPAPEEISPQSITGAEIQHTETATASKPQDSPQDAHSKTQDASKASKTDIISKASATPPEDAQRLTEDDTAHTAARTYSREELEEIAGRIAERAARKAYQRAVKEERARATAQRVRATARRVKAAGKIPAKIGKG